MDFFKNMADNLSNEISATLVIKKISGGKMSVCVSFSAKDGSIPEEMTPFILKGTAEELDNGFANAIKEPAETITGLSSNIKAFNEAAKKAQEAAAKKVSSKDDSSRKAEELRLEREKIEKEKKAKEEKFKKAMEEAKKMNENGSYCTAELLLVLADSLTEDKKAKAEIASLLASARDNKSGFLCADTAEEAEAFIKQFDTPAQPDGEQPDEPEQDEETETEDEQ